MGLQAVKRIHFYFLTKILLLFHVKELKQPFAVNILNLKEIFLNTIFNERC